MYIQLYIIEGILSRCQLGQWTAREAAVGRGQKLRFFNLPYQPNERSEDRRGAARLSLIGGARATSGKFNWLISQPNRGNGRRSSELQRAVRPIAKGELRGQAIRFNKADTPCHTPNLKRTKSPRVNSTLLLVYCELYVCSTNTTHAVVLDK